MKILIIYISPHHGNTKKVLDIMAEELKKKHGVKILEVSKADESSIKKSDMVVFGSGIYASKHHVSLLNFVDKLHEHKGKKAVIVSTSGFGLKMFHKSLREKLLEKGFKIIDEFKCKGWNTFGPFKLIGGINKGRPNEKDFEKARKFCKSIT